MSVPSVITSFSTRRPPMNQTRMPPSWNSTAMPGWNDAVMYSTRRKLSRR